MPLDFASIRVGEPVSLRAIAIFPLFAEAQAQVDYLLSNEAIKASSVVVEEVGEQGSVPELLVENKGDTRVLFLEGEQLIGAKQNRVLNTSILVAAHAKMKVPVSCVEQGRWAYKSRAFGHSETHSTSDLRLSLKKSVAYSLKANRGHRSDQGAVWDEVQKKQVAMGVSSGTGAMSDTFEQNVEKLADYRDALKYIPGAVGVAVAIGAKVVSVDLFDKPSTCEKVWARLLSGAMLDAVEHEEATSQVSPADVMSMLTSSRDAQWAEAPAVGEGREFRAEFDGSHGSALLFGETPVHVSVMAGC